MHEKNRSSVFSVLLPVGSSLVGGAFFAHSPKIRQVAFLFACQFPRKEDVPYALLLRPLAVSRTSLIRHILDKSKFTLFYLSGQIFYFFPPKIAPIKRT